MNNLQALVDELKKISSQLVTFIDEQNIEPALELVERRLIILEMLHKISNEQPEYKEEIQSLTQGLLTLEQDLISKIEQQKIILSEQLSILNRATKAKNVYKKASKE